jgi:hypothetical protein
MSRLLDTYNSKRDQYSKTFTCPVTGIELRLEKPRYRDRRTAEARARVLWREQSGERVYLEFDDLARACLLGRCLFEVGADEPLGDDVMELDEPLLDHYDAILRSIENPPIEGISDELLDEMMEDLRGKSVRVVRQLNVIEGSLLERLLRYMANRRSNSATATCSTSSSSTTT